MKTLRALTCLLLLLAASAVLPGCGGDQAGHDAATSGQPSDDNVPEPPSDASTEAPPSDDNTPTQTDSPGPEGDAPASDDGVAEDATPTPTDTQG